MPMRKVFYIVMALLLFLTLPMTAYAKPYNLKRTDFTTLSDEDMKDTIQSLVNQIVVDCGVQRPKTTSCYDWAESPVLAYNTIYCDIICVNLTGFRDGTDADAVGETVEYHLVKTLAHEVRHSYQYEHRLDGTEYGNACLTGFATYESYSGDKAAYYQQFIEADAEQYGIEYANNYFGVKK